MVPCSYFPPDFLFFAVASKSFCLLLLSFYFFNNKKRSISPIWDIDLFSFDIDYDIEQLLCSIIPSDRKNFNHFVAVCRSCIFFSFHFWAAIRAASTRCLHTARQSGYTRTVPAGIPHGTGFPSAHGPGKIPRGKDSPYLVHLIYKISICTHIATFAFLLCPFLMCAHWINRSHDLVAWMIQHGKHNTFKCSPNSAGCRPG